MNDNTEIVFIFNRRKIFGLLTRIFTGCYCYHVGIKKGKYFYDMVWMRRRTLFDSRKFPNDVYVIFESPVNIPEEFLIDKILNDNTHYGWKDYLSFSIAGITKWLKIPRKNSDGLICSEQVNKDLIENGWKSPYDKDALPSPCDLYRYFVNKYPVKEKINQ